jgi:hypothetical protein
LPLSTFTSPPVLALMLLFTSGYHSDNFRRADLGAYPTPLAE